MTTKSKLTVDFRPHNGDHVLILREPLGDTDMPSKSKKQSLATRLGKLAAQKQANTPSIGGAALPTSAPPTLQSYSQTPGPMPATASNTAPETLFSTDTSGITPQPTMSTAKAKGPAGVTYDTTTGGSQAASGNSGGGAKLASGQGAGDEPAINRVIQQQLEEGKQTYQKLAAAVLALDNVCTSEDFAKQSARVQALVTLADSHASILASAEHSVKRSSVHKASTVTKSAAKPWLSKILKGLTGKPASKGTKNILDKGFSSRTQVPPPGTPMSPEQLRSTEKMMRRDSTPGISTDALTPYKVHKEGNPIQGWGNANMDVMDPYGATVGLSGVKDVPTYQQSLHPRTIPDTPDSANPFASPPAGTGGRGYYPERDDPSKVPGIAASVGTGAAALGVGNLAHESIKDTAKAEALMARDEKILRQRKARNAETTRRRDAATAERGRKNRLVADSDHQKALDQSIARQEQYLESLRQPTPQAPTPAPTPAPAPTPPPAQLKPNPVPQPTRQPTNPLGKSGSWMDILKQAMQPAPQAMPTQTQQAGMQQPQPQQLKQELAGMQAAPQQPAPAPAPAPGAFGNSPLLQGMAPIGGGEEGGGMPMMQQQQAPQTAI